MKVLLINSYYFPDIVGGTEYSVKKLAEMLSQMGHDVIVICTAREANEEIINNVKVRRIKSRNICFANDFSNQNIIGKVLFRVLDFYNILNYNNLKKIIKEERPDIIHTNNIYGISPIIWTIAKQVAIPVVHTIRDYYIVCPKINLISKRNSNTECQKAKLICKIYRKCFEKITKNINCVTAPSDITLNTILSQNYFNNSYKQVIHNAIDFDIDNIREIFEKRKKDILTKQKVVFVYLGTLEIHKGLLWLLESFSAVKNENIELRIAGRGSLEYLVKQYEEKDSRIFYEGFCSEDKVNALLKNSDVLIIPSIWKEPFGRVILDAYKRCMPVIGSYAGAIPELIDDGKTGKVVKSNSKDELIMAISEYANNKDKIINSWENIINNIQKFSITTQGESFVKIYKELIMKSNGD